MSHGTRDDDNPSHSCLQANLPPTGPPSQSPVAVDTGATGHYFTIYADVANKRPSPRPINIIGVDDSELQSTHVADLNIHELDVLPEAARLTHIFPGMGSISLLSMGQLCDYGCQALFSKDKVEIWYNGKVILTGSRSPATNYLWFLDQSHHQSLVRTAFSAINQSANPRDLVAFAHASFFSPAIRTIKQALRENYISHFPGLTLKTLNKYGRPSKATVKGHLDRVRKNKQSTKKKVTFAPEQEDPISIDVEVEDANPEPLPKDGSTNSCFVATFDITNKVYSDQTGRFPVPSVRGNTQLFVLYHFDSNYIFLRPIKNKRKETILDACKLVYEELQLAGFTVKLHILDNECSGVLKEFFAHEGVDHMQVPPGNHRANAAERCIRTGKNHFIAGLCTTPSNFPLVIWDLLVPQAELTLNLMRGSRLNPKLSAWAQVKGPFDFNRTPIAPPGMNVLVYEDPDHRGSWGAHAIEGHYVGPALDNYRCYDIYTPSTKAVRTSDTVVWFPEEIPLPGASSTDIIARSLQEILKALQNPSPEAPIGALEPTQLEALKQLMEVFKSTLTPHPDAAVPRVSEPSSTPASVPRVPEKPAALPRVPIKMHPYNTRSKPALPPARDSAYVSRPTLPMPPELVQAHGGGTSPNEAHAQMETALLRSQLTDILDDLRFAGRAVEPIDAPEYMHIPKGFALKALNVDTGKLEEYPGLLKSSEGPLWECSTAEEFHRLCKGNEKIRGTDTLHFIHKHEVPAGRKVTYMRLVITDRPQKEQPRRVRITVGGDRLDYPFDTSTRTSDITTAKLLWNSVLSTKDARFITIDIKDFYLCTPMTYKQYMKIPVQVIPKEIMEKYDLYKKVYGGYVYVEIRKGMYGLKEAGKLAYDELKPHLEAWGFYECDFTHGLWRHEDRPIMFNLVVDDFGVQYVGDENADYLYACIDSKYKCVREEGNLFCGIHLKWDYENRTCDISIPGYVKKALQRFNHPTPAKPPACTPLVPQTQLRRAEADGR